MIPSCTVIFTFLQASRTSFLNVPGKSTVPCPVSIVHKKVSLNLGTVEYTGKIKCPANVYNKLTSAKLCSTILQLRPILTVWTRLFAYIFAKVLTIRQIKFLWNILHKSVTRVFVNNFQNEKMYWLNGPIIL